MVDLLMICVVRTLNRSSVFVTSSDYEKEKGTEPQISCFTVLGSFVLREHKRRRGGSRGGCSPPPFGRNLLHSGNFHERTVENAKYKMDGIVIDWM